MTAKPEFLPKYHDRKQISERTALVCKDPSRAQQNQKDESDINTIVRRFGLTGQLPIIERPPLEGDFSEVGTYQEARNLIRAADESFNKLPADVRTRFQNDPAAFVQFCTDPANLPAMREMGLAPPKPKESDNGKPKDTGTG